ncbi:MAG: type II toxin-antitoxin system HicB family antitoxin [Actinobacteria bacterium]|nr:MAG: type II toxin-antitoxin system HicB family antitoxin [Actinomycetota bacterium]
MHKVRFVAEQHADGFVAFPLGVSGAVVGQGESADAALADARSALRFHVDTFGAQVLEEPEPLDAFMVEDTVTTP